MKRWIEITLNLMFWLLSGWSAISAFSLSTQEIEIVDGIERTYIYRDAAEVLRVAWVVLLAIIPFYAILWGMRSVNKGEAKRSAFVLPVLAGLAVILTYFLAESYGFPNRTRLPPPLSLGIFTFYGVAAVAYGAAENWYRSEIDRRQLLVEKREIELEVLRNHLRPHFLFNALNNLLAMVDQRTHPDLALSLNRLSELLRYVTDQSGRGAVDIGREIEFLRSYCELQRLRFETDELELRFTVEGVENATQRVEPGIFLPLVENAFKHGAEPETRNRITIDFDLREPDAITFRTVNVNRGKEKPSVRTGTGIAAVRRRLELMYPGRYELSIRSEKEFRLCLSIHPL